MGPCGGRGADPAERALSGEHGACGRNRRAEEEEKREKEEGERRDGPETAERLGGRGGTHLGETITYRRAFGSAKILFPHLRKTTRQSPAFQAGSRLLSR